MSVLGLPLIYISFFRISILIIIKSMTQGLKLMKSKSLVNLIFHEKELINVLKFYPK